MNEKIAIFGAGNLGREILILIKQINKSGFKWQFEGFFDDEDSIKSLNGSPILGNLEDLNSWKEPINIVFAIAEPDIKEKLFKKISNPNVRYPTLIHPEVEHDNFQNIIVGNGSIICAGNVFTCDIKIGSHVLLNLNCSVGHDCIIHDYCSIMPGVNISGNVILEKSVYVGTGAEIINYVNIGAHATIGAGATVIESIQSNTVAVGTPARIIKFKV